MADLTEHSLLLDRLHYDPASGIFTWKPHCSMPPKWNGRFAGRQAGCLTKGRKVIRVGYQKHFASRLAWFYVHSKWPNGEVDHINCDSSDDRIANLRLATRGENCANTRKPKHNSSGLKGVTWDRARGKWMAFSAIGGGFKNLGRYDTKSEASKAYLTYAASVYGAFARAS
jgi:hypothetical protein